MHDETYEPVDPTTARNQYAALYRRTTPPDPEIEQAARRKMVTARIDKAIRLAFEDYPVALHPAQIEYLNGLLADGGAK